MSFDILVEFEALLVALDAAGTPYAVCGGLAVNIHGHVRSTRDIDLLVPPEAVSATLAAMAPLGFTIHAGPIPLGAGTEAHREIHRATKVAGDDTLTVALLVVSPILRGPWSDRETVEWRGRCVPTVSRAGLVAMKRLAGRHQDLADVESLEGSADG